MSNYNGDQILSDEISIGRNVVIHPSAVISGPDGGKAHSVHIGDNCYIGERVVIRCSHFSIGDYSRVHHDTNVHGYKPCRIGHNAWIGQFCIIDSIGGTQIGNNCGIGAHSQLWSHIKYGDTLEGCRFLSEKPLLVGADVWFVGHCIVSPIVAADRSMAMVGSVVIKDMAENTIYAGSPAAEISSKIGPQFAPVSNTEKMAKMRAYLAEHGGGDSLRIVETVDDFKADGRSYFAVQSREYTKLASAEEVSFMKYLLPARAKFTPYATGN